MGVETLIVHPSFSLTKILTMKVKIEVCTVMEIQDCHTQNVWLDQVCLGNIRGTEAGLGQAPARGSCRTHQMSLV